MCRGGTIHGDVGRSIAVEVTAWLPHPDAGGLQHVVGRHAIDWTVVTIATAWTFVQSTGARSSVQGERGRRSVGHGGDTAMEVAARTSVFVTPAWMSSYPARERSRHWLTTRCAALFAVGR